MKRLLRYVFNLAAAASLLLCVAVGVLWAGSGRLARVQVRYTTAPQADARHAYYFEAAAYSGTLGFDVTRQLFEPVYVRALPAISVETLHQSYPLGWRSSASGPAETMWTYPRTPGFRADHNADASKPGYLSESWDLALPQWLAMAVLLVMPAVWLVRFGMARRVRRLGLCPACGYDLRASPDRCPECGRVAAAKGAA